jgi:hypothetical protein
MYKEAPSTKKMAWWSHGESLQHKQISTLTEIAMSDACRVADCPGFRKRQMIVRSKNQQVGKEARGPELRKKHKVKGQNYCVLRLKVYRSGEHWI